MPVTGRTRVAGVAGWPVEHSLSPVMHNTAYRSIGLDWTYVALPVRPEDAVGTLRAAWSLGFEGLSVTMPHKQAAAEAASTASPDVKRVGAANTLLRGEYGWHAENTDVGGFRAFLTGDLGYAVEGRHVGILGAGGVASAVVAAVTPEAGRISIWNRTSGRALTLAESAGADICESPGDLAACDVVVSCLPAGVVPDGLGFRGGQVVVDMVYAPPRTDVMERAATAGAEVHNGLGMLVQQAALQFLLWTGRPAPINVMSAAAVRAIHGDHNSVE